MAGYAPRKRPVREQWEADIIRIMETRCIRQPKGDKRPRTPWTALDEILRIVRVEIDRRVEQERYRRRRFVRR